MRTSVFGMPLKSDIQKGIFLSKKIPIYLKIHDEIKNSIDRGIYRFGDKLSSERELAQKYQVTRMTIRQAINALSEEGIVERKLGAGTFVADNKIQEKITGTTSFTEITKKQGKNPSSRTIAFFKTSPNLEECEQLKITPKEQIVKMERIRYADQLPICLEIASIPVKLIHDFSKEELTTSFYQSLQKHGLIISRSRQNISATLATEKIAKFLQIKKGSAILLLQQVSFLKDSILLPFEYVRSQYVGTRFEFFLEKTE
jgi:GntR family transcriptional regulator